MISDKPEAVIAACDGIIDFTVPKATLSLIRHTAAASKVHVIGTTGIDVAGDAEIAEAAKSATIVKIRQY